MIVDGKECELYSNTGAHTCGEVLMSTVSISLNPLMCTAIEIGGAPTGADRLLDFVMAPDVERTCEAFVCRYREANRHRQLRET